MMAVQQRRWAARAVKLGLVGLAVAVVLAWIGSHREHRRETRVERHPVPKPPRMPRIEHGAAAVEALGPGDVRIYNQDSSINLILRGDEVLAGLSPQMRTKIEEQILQSTTDDTTGFKAAVANVVRSTVAGAIATYAAFPVRDIRDIEYRDGEMIIVREDGSRSTLMGNRRHDGGEVSRTFSPEDARHFIERVRERKRALERRR